MSIIGYINRAKREDNIPLVIAVSEIVNLRGKRNANFTTTKIQKIQKIQFLNLFCKSLYMYYEYN